MSDAGRTGYAEAFASGEFRALMGTQFLEIGGLALSSVALTVLVYRRTASPFLASLTFALNFVPYLFAGALLSALVDRIRPRRLMAGCDGLAAGLLAVMALPGLPLGVLFTVLFATGLLASLSAGGRGSVTRASVSHEAYVPARSLLRVTAQIAQLGGNAGGGALLLLLSSRGLLLADAVLLLGAALTVTVLVTDHPMTGTAAERMLLGDSLHGMRQVFGHPELRRLILFGGLAPMFFVAPEAVAAPYVAAHHARPSSVGLWLIALPIGLIASDAGGIRLLSPAQRARVFAPAAVVQFIPYLAFVANPGIAPAIALIAVAGGGSLYVLDLDRRVRDATTPELFARVMTLNSSVLAALQGLGFALAGGIAQATSPSAAIAIAGVAGILVSVGFLHGELLTRRH